MKVLNDIISGKRNNLSDIKLQAMEELKKVVEKYPSRYIGFGSVPIGLSYDDTSLYIEKNIVKNKFVGLGESNIGGERVSSPLAAASPMVSGMGRFQEVADINCKVVVEVNDRDKENAKSIIKSLGGTTDDPNAKLPKGLDNISEGAFIRKSLKD